MADVSFAAMLFNSYQFLLVFLPGALLLWHGMLRLGRPRLALWLLLGLSLAFYAAWEPVHLTLLLASIGCNFALSRRIAHGPAAAARRWLTLGVAANLTVLGVFKYAGFFSDVFAQASGIDLGWHTGPLPLAISFFTFQQIAFLVHAWRARSQPPLRDYATAVAFFPHLVAGPIVRYEELMPQFQRIADGRGGQAVWIPALVLFSIGLFKKTWLADPLGAIADPAFAGHAVGLADAWISATAFGLQIYFDFSGYSDMALGLAWLFGIRLPQNFDSPYRAASLIDFWRRWHMTLSQFLRDHLYVPLGGREHLYRNLIITMLLCGLWHGAGWPFLLWGALHAAALCVNHGWRRAGYALPRWLAWPLLLLFVIVAWVPFRTPELAQAWQHWQGMLGLNGWGVRPSIGSGGAWSIGREGLFTLVAGMIAAVLPWNANRWADWAQNLSRTATQSLAAMACAGLFTLGLMLMTRQQQFIYFNF